VGVGGVRRGEEEVVLVGDGWITIGGGEEPDSGLSW